MPVTLLVQEGMALPHCTHWVLWESAVPVAAWQSGRITLRGEETVMTAQTRTSSSPRAATRAPARRRVVARLWLAAERQVAEIEARLTTGGDPAALERDAKTFALIARTVRDLVALDMEAETHAKEKRRPHASKDEPAGPGETDDAGFGSRDIEDFRAELARRLAALRDEGAASNPA